MPPRPQSHYARGHQRRAEVIEATIDVIAKEGIEGVTHRSVAAAAGVPLSTTSYFFSSLDALIGAAVTQIAADVVEEVGAIVPGTANEIEPTPTDTYIDRLIQALSVARTRQAVVQFEAYLAATRRPELQGPVRRIVSAYEDAAEAVYASLGVTDPRTAARQLLALVDGLSLQEIASPRPDDADIRRDAIKKLAAVHLGMIK